ncbi:hypothetical protein [Spirosoma linguale]|uniref:hypothetical protein n=1 Tax=Spirosoma linguale TaxID=108 RepID=UPI0001A3C1C1
MLSNPQSAGASFYGDTNPYAETIYEASPSTDPPSSGGRARTGERPTENSSY